VEHANYLFYPKSAKGKPYVAPDMAKAATTSSIKMPSSWIGSASDQLIRKLSSLYLHAGSNFELKIRNHWIGGTADAIQYVDKPTPKIKMWMTVNDPNGPWKQEKAIPAKATSTGAAVSEVVAPAEEAKEEVKV